MGEAERGAGDHLAGFGIAFERALGEQGLGLLDQVDHPGLELLGNHFHGRPDVEHRDRRLVGARANAIKHQISFTGLAGLDEDDAAIEPRGNRAGRLDNVGG